MLKKQIVKINFISFIKGENEVNHHHTHTHARAHAHTFLGTSFKMHLNNLQQISIFKVRQFKNLFAKNILI